MRIMNKIVKLYNYAEFNAILNKAIWRLINMNTDEVPASCSLCSRQIVEATKRYNLKEENKKLLLGLPCKLLGERRFVLTGYLCKDCHFSLKRRKSLMTNCENWKKSCM